MYLFLDFLPLYCFLSDFAQCCFFLRAIVWIYNLRGPHPMHLNLHFKTLYSSISPTLSLSLSLLLSFFLSLPISLSLSLCLSLSFSVFLSLSVSALCVCVCLYYAFLANLILSLTPCNSWMTDFLAKITTKWSEDKIASFLTRRRLRIFLCWLLLV